MNILKEDIVYNLKKSVITIRKDGILEISPNENSCIDHSDFQRGLQFINTKLKGRKLPVLFIPGENSEVTSEFRKLASSEIASKYTIADALVVDSLPHRMIGNFYLKFNKPVRPTRIFKNKEDALLWLRSQMQ